MTETPSENLTCMDSEYDPTILTVEQAQQRIANHLTPIISSEQVDIRRSLNRVLTTDVCSNMDIPPYANSAMDGYAVNSEDIPDTGSQTLQKVATIMAGTPFNGELVHGQCARIMTGAKLPQGADTVIMQEHVQAHGDNITISAQHKAGDNVRLAGEDIRRGDVVLHRGRRLNAADVGVLASLGMAEVKVYRKVRVAFFSTGDELTPLGSPLEEGQIYDSNRYTLFSMLSQFGAEIIDMGAIADDRNATEAAFQSAAANADVLITSGGVSVGDADYVKDTLENLGQVDFWKIAMKPGRPLAFGHLGNCAFFGLPGNPVSAMVTFYIFVQPALRLISGQLNDGATVIELPCASTLKKRPGRMEFQRGVIETNENGKQVVRSTGGQGSHILSSMSAANCFILLPLECERVESGEMVKVQPFYGLF
ncbi:molybdopterin molybdotransferase MoeA [Kaarinaea lacus]